MKPWTAGIALAAVAISLAAPRTLVAQQAAVLQMGTPTTEHSIFVTTPPSLSLPMPDSDQVAPGDDDWCAESWLYSPPAVTVGPGELEAAAVSGSAARVQPLALDALQSAPRVQEHSNERVLALPRIGER